MRYYFTFSRIAKINQTDNKNVVKDVEKQELSYIAGGDIKRSSHFRK